MYVPRGARDASETPTDSLPHILESRALVHRAQALDKGHKLGVRDLAVAAGVELPLEPGEGALRELEAERLEPLPERGGAQCPPPSLIRGGKGNDQRRPRPPRDAAGVVLEAPSPQRLQAELGELGGGLANL